MQAALEEAEATLEQEENKNARIQLEIEQVNRYRVFEKKTSIFKGFSKNYGFSN